MALIGQFTNQKIFFIFIAQNIYLDIHIWMHS